MYRADGRCANLAHFEAPVFVGPSVVDVVGAAVEVVVILMVVISFNQRLDEECAGNL